MENIKNINSICYKEIMVILSNLSNEDLIKIPNEKLEYFYKNMDNDYEYKLDDSKSFQEQNMHPITELILANLYLDYLATPTEKDKFHKVQLDYFNKLEKKKNLKYNPNDLFKNNVKKETINNDNNNDNLQLIEYKESILKKLLNKIKNIFKSQK